MRAGSGNFWQFLRKAGNSNSAGAATTQASARDALGINIATRGYIDGLLSASYAGDINNDIALTNGVCMSDDGTDFIQLTGFTGANPLIKQVDAAWAVGTNAGALDTGLASTDGTYSLYAIKRPDTGVVDALASLSNDSITTCSITNASPAVVTISSTTAAGGSFVDGSGIRLTTTGSLPTGLSPNTQYYVRNGAGTGIFNLSATPAGALINTSSAGSGVHTIQGWPTMPTNYTLKRRLASFRRGSSVNTAYTQFGDEFLLNTPATDITLTSGLSGLLASLVSVPLGIRVFAKLNVQLQHSAAARLIITSPDQTNVTPASALCTLIVNNARAATDMIVRTNYEAQVRYRLSVSPVTEFNINVFGWYDLRGKDRY